MDSELSKQKHLLLPGGLEKGHETGDRLEVILFYYGPFSSGLQWLSGQQGKESVIQLIGNGLGRVAFAFFALKRPSQFLPPVPYLLYLLEWKVSPKRVSLI